MKPTFRVVIALVHTGSRLANGDCGTKIKVFAVPPIAGPASVAAAAPSSRLRRCILVVPPGSVGSLAQRRGALYLLTNFQFDYVQQARWQVTRHTLGDEHDARGVIGRRP